MTLRLRACRLQIPVGFGGFHLAFLGPCRGGEGPFVLAYDCGSLRPTHACLWAARVGSTLRRCGMRIGLAVLSHTDFDHVCAIEALAKNVGIDTLVIPALAWQVRAGQLAEHSSRGGPYWYRKFLMAPADWAREQGIDRVVFVEPAARPDSDDRDRRDQRDSNDGGSRPTLVLGPSARRWPAPAEGDIGVCSGEPLEIKHPTTPSFWKLVPIRADASNEEEAGRALVKAVRGLSVDEVLQGLSVRGRGKQALTLRNRLARVYKKHWKSTNASSLMLLASPASGQGGWLCTGDARLTDTRVQADLLKQGGPYLPSIDAVQVPHHGSPHNMDARAAKFLWTSTKAKTLTWIVSSGPNNWKYPHANVRAACQQYGAFVRVDLADPNVTCF